MSQKVEITLPTAPLFSREQMEKMMRDLCKPIPDGPPEKRRYMPRLRPGNRTFRKAKRK